MSLLQNSTVSPLNSFLNFGAVQSLLTLNYCLVGSINQLFGDKNQDGSILNGLSSQQKEKLLHRFQTDTDLNRKFQMFSAITEPIPTAPLQTPTRGTKLANGDRKAEELSFEPGIFKKRKISDEKNIAVSEIRSEASTECEFSILDDVNRKRKNMNRPKKSKHVSKDKENMNSNENPTPMEDKLRIEGGSGLIIGS